MINKLLKLKIEEAKLLLDITGGNISNTHNIKEFDLSTLKDDEKLKNLSSIFKGKQDRVLGVTEESDESNEIAKTISGSVDMISRVRIKGESIDISALKYISGINNIADKVVLSLRMTSIADTREGKKVGIATRTLSGKSKEVPQVVTVLTGLSDTQLTMLEKLIELTEGVRNVVLGSSYMRLDKNTAKEAYLANYKYRKCKERIYKDRERNDSEDLAARQTKLNEIASYRDIGDQSMDLSIYSTYSTKNLNSPSDFGNVMENELGLKRIKEDEIGNGIRIYSRTCPELVRPAKATYMLDMKEDVEDIVDSMQILQILVLSSLSYEEIRFTEVDKLVSFNEEKVLEILDENIEIVNMHEFSTISKLENAIEVTDNDKIKIQNEISETLTKISNSIVEEKFSEMK